MKERILIACNDPGGSMVCLPVIKRLLKDDKYYISIFAGKYAEKIFKEEKIACKTLRQSRFTKKEMVTIERILKEEEPSLVFTSTSFGKAIDNAFLYAAIKRKKKTFALLDQWCNYTQRFRVFSRNKKIGYIPDLIGVMDNFTKQEMIDEGFPAKRLIVTGHPYFDTLIGQNIRLPKTKQSSFRKKLGIPPKNLIIVFASEPFRKGDLRMIGYTDIIIARALIRSLESIAEKAGKPITFLIKIHPRDERKDSVFPLSSSPWLQIVLARPGRATDFIQNADIVVGMQSIFLIESFLLGKPTLNIQIDRKNKDTLLTNKMGLTKAIESYEMLNKTLSDIIIRKTIIKNNSNHSCFAEMDGKSTDRVISIINKILCKK